VNAKSVSNIEKLERRQRGFEKEENDGGSV
jgi:hypothetical protein